MIIYQGNKTYGNRPTSERSTFSDFEPPDSIASVQIQSRASYIISAAPATHSLPSHLKDQQTWRSQKTSGHTEIMGSHDS